MAAQSYSDVRAGASGRSELVAWKCYGRWRLHTENFTGCG